MPSGTTGQLCTILGVVYLVKSRLSPQTFIAVQCIYMYMSVYTLYMYNVCVPVHVHFPCLDKENLDRSSDVSNSGFDSPTGKLVGV